MISQNPHVAHTHRRLWKEWKAVLIVVCEFASWLTPFFVCSTDAYTRSAFLLLALGTCCSVAMRKNLFWGARPSAWAELRWDRMMATSRTWMCNTAPTWACKWQSKFVSSQLTSRPKHSTMFVKQFFYHLVFTLRIGLRFRWYENISTCNFSSLSIFLGVPSSVS